MTGHAPGTATFDDATAAAAAIDGRALLDQLDAIGQIGREQGGGVTRTSFSREFVQGRDLVARYCRELGLATHVDAVGNLIAEPTPLETDCPVILVGSHLDTVVGAGVLDGAYGVLAGLGAIAAVWRAGVVLRHRVLLAGFVNEEGAGGTSAMLGSKACAGRLLPEDLDERDSRGATVAQLVEQIGGTPESYLDADLSSGGRLAGYLELHIEQGPVLEAAGCDIGVVSAITGRVLVDVECVGAACHAGTTPMDRRADALLAAARVVGAIDDIARRGVARVGTAGILDVVGAARNTVPGRVHIAAEFRDDEATRMEAAVIALRRAADEIASRSGVEIAVDVVDVVAPCPTDAGLRTALSEAAAICGVPALALTSGAGHDAQSFHGQVPIGMLFVPSVAGVSHSPHESTPEAALRRGAAVLAAALVVVDRRLPDAHGGARGDAGDVSVRA